MHSALGRGWVCKGAVSRQPTLSTGQWEAAPCTEEGGRGCFMRVHQLPLIRRLPLIARRAWGSVGSLHAYGERAEGLGRICTCTCTCKGTGKLLHLQRWPAPPKGLGIPRTCTCTCTCTCKGAVKRHARDRLRLLHSVMHATACVCFTASCTCGCCTRGPHVASVQVGAGMCPAWHRAGT